MKQKFDFLSGLDKIKGQNLFQEFIIEMGISKHTIHIPLKEADMFAEKANSMRPNSIKELKELIVQFNGSLEE